MDLALPTFNLIPPKESGIDMASPVQEAVGSNQTFTNLLQEANTSSGEVASNVITILSAIQNAARVSNGEEQQPAGTPEGMLQLISLVLRTVLGKTALMDIGKAATCPNATSHQMPQANEGDTSSEDGEETQPVHPALIEQIVATVLTQLQAQIQKFAEAPDVDPNEGRASSIPSGDRLRDVVTTLVRRLLAQGMKTDAPAPSSADDKVALPTDQEPDLTTHMAAELDEPLSTEGQKTEPASRETVNSAHALIPSTVLPTVNKLEEPIDDGVMWADAPKPTNETPELSARGGDTSHSHEETAEQQSRRPDPDLRQGETFVLFEVKETEAIPMRQDRSSTAPVRQSASQAWQEFEPAPTHPSVNLEVSPPEVGRVRLHVALAGERIYASVITEHAGVRDYLLAEQPRLEGGLSAKGLEMGSFQVAVEHQEAGNRDKRNPLEWGQNLSDRDASRTRVIETPSEERGVSSHREIQVNVLSLFA